MNRLLSLSVLALPLLLAACGGGTTVPTAPAASGPVTLLVNHNGYLNLDRTTRIDVQVDTGTPHPFNAPGLPCDAAGCTLVLGPVSSGEHTFTVSTYGRNADGQDVVISQGQVSQTVWPGTPVSMSPLLVPVHATTVLASAVQQYDPAAHAFGNYARFATSGGRSLPAYYDIGATDSVGDPIDVVLCGDFSRTHITDLTGGRPRRVRVELTATGPTTLTLQAGTYCDPNRPAMAAQTVEGVVTTGQTLATGNSGSHSLVIMADHTVQSWGSNADGQLGDGTTEWHTTPVAVPDLTDVVEVAAGARHSLALRSNGQVFAWGGNGYGELGNGTQDTVLVATRLVHQLNDVVAISANNAFSLALLADGTVRGWGYNGSGELGSNANPGANLLPVTIPELRGVSGVTAGGGFGLALLPDGTVKAWGENSAGSLGDGTTTSRPTPVTVPHLSGVTALSAGVAHTVALLGDGSVWAWGYNVAGQVGVDTARQPVLTPRQVPSLSGVTRVAAGYAHSLAVLSDGTLRAWGSNSYGQLGVGMIAGSDSSASPVTVVGIHGAVGMAGGPSHTIAALADGSLWAWGYNTHGELGNGTATTLESTPVAVHLGSALVPTR